MGWHVGLPIIVLHHLSSWGPTQPLLLRLCIHDTVLCGQNRNTRNLDMRQERKHKTESRNLRQGTLFGCELQRLYTYPLSILSPIKITVLKKQSEPKVRKSPADWMAVGWTYHGTYPVCSCYAPATRRILLGDFGARRRGDACMRTLRHVKGRLISLRI